MLEKYLMYLWNVSKQIVKVVTHTSLEVSVGQKKELLKPPIWGCCGPTGGSIFTPGQKNHPAFSEIAAKTHGPFGPYLAGQFACIPPALKKAGCLICPAVKNEPPVGPQQPQIGGIKSSFFLAN